jgi:hypothetical protein
MRSTPPEKPPFSSNDSRAPMKAKSLPDLLLEVTNRIFKREAALFLGLMVAGAGSALWARAWADEKQQEKIDAGIAPLSSELHRHIKESEGVHARQEVAQLRTESKVDRLDTRMEQLLEAVYANRGQTPPPAPPLAAPVIIQDAGTADGGH